jgi:hypothetical protein
VTSANGKERSSALNHAAAAVDNPASSEGGLNGSIPPPANPAILALNQVHHGFLEWCKAGPGGGRYAWGILVLFGAIWC